MNTIQTELLICAAPTVDASIYNLKLMFPEAYDRLMNYSEEEQAKAVKAAMLEMSAIEFTDYSNIEFPENPDEFLVKAIKAELEKQPDFILEAKTNGVSDEECVMVASEAMYNAEASAERMQAFRDMKIGEVIGHVLHVALKVF